MSPNNSIIKWGRRAERAFCLKQTKRLLQEGSLFRWHS